MRESRLEDSGIAGLARLLAVFAPLLPALVERVASLVLGVA